VISDTHIPVRADDLPVSLWDEIERADAVIHAGDVVSADFLKRLESKKEVFAVFGNMDEISLRRSLPEKRIVELEGVRVGVIHGGGSPEGLEERVRRAFHDVDVIVFGHTHKAFLQESSILMLNPGSPTDTIFTKCRTYGIIEIENGRARGRIIEIG